MKDLGKTEHYWYWVDFDSAILLHCTEDVLNERRIRSSMEQNCTGKMIIKE